MFRLTIRPSCMGWKHIGLITTIGHKAHKWNHLVSYQILDVKLVLRRSAILTCIPVADLGFLKGGFRLRRITVIERIVSSWQASMSTQRLRSRRPSARSAENFRNLGPLRSHLLAFQAPYSEHWSGGRRNCRICSTAPVGLPLIASFYSWLVKLTVTSQWPCRQIF